MMIYKFRAFDKKIGRFHYWDSRSQKHDNIFWDMAKKEGMPVEQFSGKRDGYLIDIWAGDIMIDVEHFDDPNNLEFRRLQCVGFAYGGFVLHDVGDDPSSSRRYLNLHQDYDTVVGNIHQSDIEILKQLKVSK